MQVTLTGSIVQQELLTETKTISAGASYFSPIVDAKMYKYASANILTTNDTVNNPTVSFFANGTNMQFGYSLGTVTIKLGSKKNIYAEKLERKSGDKISIGVTNNDSVSNDFTYTMHGWRD